MRIYGKTLSTIYHDLPWPYKIVFVAAALFLTYTVIFLIYFLFTYGVPKKQLPGPVNMISWPGGALDPAIATDGSGVPKNMMAATVLTPPPEGKSGVATEIHLFSADSECNSWSHLSAVFDAQDENLLAPDGETTLAQGFWRVETPALVYDPDDPGKEWKIFAYKYFWSGNMKLTGYYSTIVYKYAHDPFQKWSDEQWLFAARPDYPPAPYGDLVQHKLNTLSPALADVMFYTRPSVVYDQGVMLMSLSAFTQSALSNSAAGPALDRIVMIASFDHGKSWQYLGTPLSAADLPNIGPYTKLQGATLLRAEGQLYLAAVLGDKDTAGLGTFLFPFDDLAKATLQRDGKDVPVLARHIPRLSAQPTATGGGFAAYLPTCKGGIITSEFSGLRRSFQIFNSYQRPAAE